MMLAYFGAEGVMPALSAVAAALGMLMMFNRYLLLYGRGLVEWLRFHPRR